MPDPRTAEDRLPLSDDEIARLRAEAESEQHYPGKHGQWERLVLRLLATLDAALAADPVPAPLDVDLLQQAMVERFPWWKDDPGHAVAIVDLYVALATPPEPEP